MKFFPGQGKVREFCGWQGNLERTWKVREKSGNLKINSSGSQSSENLFILLKRGKDVLLRDNLSPFPSSLGASLEEKYLLPLGANSFL